MKKSFKRILATVLTVVMVMTAVPLNVFAKETTSTKNPDEAFKSDSTVGGSSGMDYILSNLSQTNTDDPDSGCSVRNCLIEGKNATVYYTAAKACKLVVAIYDEETKQMLASGMEDITADSDSAVVTIDIAAMPAYYLAKVFMLDENMAALSSQYTFYEHTSVYEEFMSVTPDDFDADRIVEFGENDVEESFGALNEDVVRGDYTTSMTVSYNSDNGTYTFENAIPEVKTLSVGETFYYEDEAEHEVILLKVKNITVSGNIVVVTEDEDIALDDAFDYMRYDEGLYWDDSVNEVEIGDGVVSHSGVEVIENEASFNLDSVAPGESDTLTTSDEDSGLEKEDNLLNDSFTLDYPNSVKSKSPKEQSFLSAGCKITGTIGYTLGANARLHWDVKIGPDYFEFKVETEHKLEFDVSVSGTIEVNPDKVFWSLGGKDEDGNEKGIPLGKTGLFKLYVKIYPVISLSLNVDLLKFTIISAKNTGINSDDGYYSNSSEKKFFDGEPIWSDYDNSKIEFKFGVGINVEVGRKFGKKDKNGNHKVTATIGFTVEVYFDTTLNADKIDKNRHNCRVCFNGDLDFCVEGNAAINIKIFNVLSKVKNPKIKDHVKDGKFSFQFAAFSLSWDLTEFYIGWDSKGNFNHGFGACPNKKTAVTVLVCDKDGKGIKDVSVESNTVSEKTNENGKAEFYFTPGTYTLKITYNGEIKTESVSVSEFDKSITVKFDNSGSSSGTGDDDIFTGNESVGDIIKFGSYPQSKVTDSATISALDAKSKTWISYGYYSGTGFSADGHMKPSDYMKYCDISYNGNKYRAVTFSYYRPSCTSYELNNDVEHTRQDDNDYYTDNIYYFKYEPLSWRVLDPSEGFVMCEKAIDSQAYNNYISSYNYNNDYYGNSAKTYYASDWANSSLRAWLNNDFYNTAFTSTEKSQIGTTYNENKSTYSSECDSADTSDKIFLLSYNEVLNTKYGFNSSYSTYDTARQIKSTDYAQCQGCYKNTSTSYLGNSWWWLRSPDVSLCANLVGYVGDAFNYNEVNYTVGGIVPALRLEKSTIKKSPARSLKFAVAPKSAEKADGINITYSACKAGGEYILLNVLDYSEEFILTNDKLLYIDQLTADENGKVNTTFIPKYNDSTSTTLLIGDFGKGVEAKVIQKVDTSVSISDIEVKYKDTAKFKPTVTIVDGVKYTVKYESSNPSVATVDKDGNITTLHKGDTTITCTVTDEYGNVAKDSCNVNVYFSFGQWLIWILLFGFLWY